MWRMEQLGDGMEDGCDVDRLGLGGAEGAGQHAGTEDKRNQCPGGDQIP